MSYQKAIEFLDSLYNHERDAQRISPLQFHLDAIVQVLKKLGNPHLEYPVVHITGTKGKGSVAAMLTAILKSAGIKVGTYTSPHLIDVRERIAINGKMISQKKFIEAINAARKYMGKRPKEFGTYFEALTSAAFWIFAKEKTDIAVIEVGMGGTYDATNVVSPEIAVLTRIGLDHTERLGETIAKIATDKAGIIKLKCKVVVSPQEKEALIPIMARAQNAGAEIYRCISTKDKNSRKISSKTDLKIVDFSYDLVSKTLDGTDVVINLPGSSFSVRLPVIGGFQGENAATAAMTASLLKISQDKIIAGLEKAKILGRMQLVHRRPNIIIDGAHNPTSAETTAYELLTLGLAPAIFVIAINSPKDFRKMLMAWAKVAKLFIFTTTGSSRSYDPQMLASEAEHSFGIRALIENSPENAVERAMEISAKDGTIFTAGSLYLAGKLLNCFKKRCNIH